MNNARQQFSQFILWIGLMLSSQSLLVYAADPMPSNAPVINKAIKKTATQQSNQTNFGNKPTKNLSSQSQSQLPLDSIQAIQLIGRSVLAAKHSENIDPKTVQMKQRLVALQKSVDEMIEADIEIVPKELNSMNAVEITAETERTKSKNKSNIAKDIPKADAIEKQQKYTLRKQQKTAALQQRLNDLKADQNTYKQTEMVADQHERQPHMQNLMAKSEALSMEITAALADDDASRREKLNKLRDRLKVKNMGEMQAISSQEETPTISTITKHRE